MSPPAAPAARATSSVTLRPRERRLALIAGVVIGCWLFVSWLVQPLWDQANDLRLRVERQTGKLEALNRLARQGPAIEARYQRVAAYLAGSDDERAQSAFLNELELLSRELGLHVNLKPRPSKRDDRVSRFDVELDVEGAQETLLAFVDRLLAMPTLMAVERLRLSTIPTKADQLRANLVIQHLAIRQP